MGQYISSRIVGHAVSELAIEQWDSKTVGEQGGAGHKHGIERQLVSWPVEQYMSSGIVRYWE